MLLERADAAEFRLDPRTVEMLRAGESCIQYRINVAAHLNITMDEALYARLKRELPPKRISAFVEAAVKASLRPDRKTLDRAYRAAAKEKWRQREPAAWRSTEVEEWPE